MRENPKKYGYASLYSVGMGSYKHIETCIGDYLVNHYSNAVEVGIGKNAEVARIFHEAGRSVRCTDISDVPLPKWLIFKTDDIFSPDISFYQGVDLIYAVRPAIEMIPPLIALARIINCDVLVYHLGFESYGNGGEKIDCGVILHRYVSKYGSHLPHPLHRLRSAVGAAFLRSYPNAEGLLAARFCRHGHSLGTAKLLRERGGGNRLSPLMWPTLLMLFAGLLLLYTER